MYRLTNVKYNDDDIIYEGELRDFIWEETSDGDVINHINDYWDNISVPGFGDVSAGQTIYALCEKYDEYDWSNFFEEYVDYIMDYIQDCINNEEKAIWKDYIITQED